MDADDAIQQLLKSTGWSCDDLFAKLQRYKSQKEDKNKIAQPGSSTEAEKVPADPVCSSTTKDVKENDTKVENHRDSEDKNKTTNVVGEERSEKTAVCDITIEEFSESDEEENEINATQSNIIDEIIDDIASSSVDNEELNCRIENARIESQAVRNEEQEEVTEIQVIEVDEGDEDDCFDEDSCGASKNDSLVETFPRISPVKLAPKNLGSIDKDDSTSQEIVELNTDKEQEILEGADNNSSSSEEKLETVNLESVAKLRSPWKNSSANDNKKSSDEEDAQKDDPKVVNSPTNVNSDEKVLDTVTSKRDKVEDEPALTDLENLRNNLKLQLTCLRTRKKQHLLQPLRTEVVDTSECSKRKLNITATLTNPVSSTTDLESHEEVAHNKSYTTDGGGRQHDLYTQTNEFGLVILSVQGGIELDEADSNKNVEDKVPDLTNEESSNTYSSAIGISEDSNSVTSQGNLENEVNETGVLDEIRKIIRKQKHNSKSDTKCVPEPSHESKKVVNNFNFFSTPKRCPSTSTDTSTSSFVNDEISRDKNSPFVSNSLDEFLTVNSKLNISYNVPKSNAEDGLTVNYHQEESPLILRKVVKIDNEQAPALKKMETIKAKTVAQKRKLLERQRLRELKKAEKLKLKSQNEPTVISETTPKQKKESYIEINNTKLWVRGTEPNKCLVKISSAVDTRTSIPRQQCRRRRKLSLLNDLVHKNYEKIKYRPGPLSRKSTLQVSGCDGWETEMKLLPKVTLEVMPKIGQRLPPHIISRLPQTDGDVTAGMAEFALSVLKTKKEKVTREKIFQFPMKYANNQEKIIVRKKKVIPIKYEIEASKEVCADDVVAKVIDDLIRYVEIKEIAPTLIKEDETVSKCNDYKPDKMPTIADNITNIFKKPHKKKSKVELELSRLSCKVVNVEVEENSAEELCSKPYCRLGCVCKSLKCDGMITYHCQNIACMLECKCPRERSIEYDKLMLPAGTDILSRDTVTRIEDEAKKDLAKVEREFTQTVIHTNDKTIVVGIGGRHKTRRSAKAPVKYSDYFDTSSETFKENEKPKVKDNNDFSKQCVVDLRKLNVRGIIPYCLFHNLYNCLCVRYQSSPKEVARKANGAPISEPTIEETPTVSKRYKRITTRQVIDEDTEESPTVSKRYPRNVKPTPPKQPTPQEPTNDSDSSSSYVVTASGRHVRINKRLREGFTCFKQHALPSTGCARTDFNPQSIKPKRKRTMRTLKKLTKDDFSENISQADILRSKLKTTSHYEVDILKRQLILEAESEAKSNALLVENALSALDQVKHKRKQIIEVRSDDATSNTPTNEPPAMQRRKKPAPITIKDTVVQPVFEGEIIVDKRNMELLQKMGNKTVMEGYARLLPWRALIDGFNKGGISIWCMVDQPSRLLINKSDKSPPKNYIDIRQTSQTTEVIQWCLNKALPPRYQEDQVSFILKQTKDNYEICGLCTKNLGDSVTSSTGVNSEIESPQSSKISTDSDIDNDVKLFKHKDLNGAHQMMCLVQGKFKLQELVEENLAAIGETSVEKNRLYMWVALPEIYRTCKWRMIFLNSDFSFLYFTKVKYSIKYTDLLSASNQAKEGKCTVILRNSVICNPYDHSAFGIYFDAHYQDRLFIGPYFKQHMDDDIETLRYINKSLVCTESFNKMQGKMNYKCGHWLIERPYNCTIKRPAFNFTSDTEGKSPKRKNDVDSDNKAKKLKSDDQHVDRIIVTPKNEQVKVLDGVARKPEEFNRYVTTNIPNLGYLGAFQHENLEIDVSWPFENKLLRFENVKTATDFLQCRFSSLLTPVPETFTIEVKITDNIDLDNTKPISSSILSGHHICGYFGYHNVKNLTKDFCLERIGTTREELMRICARRAQLRVLHRMEELADIVNIPNSDEGRLDIVYVLDRAVKDVESLTRTEQQLVVQKNDLLLRKRDLAKQAFCMISILPERERDMESWKFRRILRRESLLVPKTVLEPIEIPDSDEEEQQTSQSGNSTSKDAEQKPSSSTITSPVDVKEQHSKSAEIITVPDVEPKVSQTAVSTYTPQRKLKSILKSNVTPPPPAIPRVEPSVKQPVSTVSQPIDNINNTSAPPKQQYLSGVKIVKSADGKLMLVSNNPAVAPGSLKMKSGGIQLVMKNNTFASLTPVSSDKKDGALSACEKQPNSVCISPPKTIILNKKDIMLSNPQFFAPGGDRSVLKSNCAVTPTKNDTTNLHNFKVNDEATITSETSDENGKNVANNAVDLETDIFQFKPIKLPPRTWIKDNEGTVDTTVTDKNSSDIIKATPAENNVNEDNSPENNSQCLLQTPIDESEVGKTNRNIPDEETIAKPSDNDSEAIRSAETIEINSDAVLQKAPASAKSNISDSEITTEIEPLNLQSDCVEKSGIAERVEIVLKNVDSFASPQEKSDTDPNTNFVQDSSEETDVTLVNKDVDEERNATGSIQEIHNDDLGKSLKLSDISDTEDADGTKSLNSSNTSYFSSDKKAESEQSCKTTYVPNIEEIDSGKSLETFNSSDASNTDPVQIEKALECADESSDYDCHFNIDRLDKEKSSESSNSSDVSKIEQIDCQKSSESSSTCYLDKNLKENNDQYFNNEETAPTIEESSSVVSKTISSEDYEASAQIGSISKVSGIDNKDLKENIDLHNNEESVSVAGISETLSTEIDSNIKIPDVDNKGLIENCASEHNQEIVTQIGGEIEETKVEPISVNVASENSPSEYNQEVPTQTDLINKVYEIESNGQLLNNELASEECQEMSKQNDAFNKVSDVVREDEPKENSTSVAPDTLSSQFNHETSTQGDLLNTVSDVDNKELLDNNEQQPNNKFPHENDQEILAQNDLINKLSDNKAFVENNELSSQNDQELLTQNDSINAVSDIVLGENNEQYPINEFSSEPDQEMLTQPDSINKVSDVESNDQPLDNELDSEEYHEMSKQYDSIDKVSDIDNEPVENNAQYHNKEFSSEQCQETKQNDSNHKVSDIDNDLVEDIEQYSNNEVPSDQIHQMSQNHLINKVSDIESNDQPLNKEYASDNKNYSTDKVSNIDNEPVENNARHPNKEFSSEQYQEMLEQNDSIKKVSDIDNDLVEDLEQYPNNEEPSDQIHQMSQNDLINKVSEIESNHQPLNKEYASDYKNDSTDKVSDIDNEPVENKARHPNKEFSSEQYQETLIQNDSVNRVSDVDNDLVGKDEQYRNNEVPSEQVHEMSQNDLINKVSDLESNDQPFNCEHASEEYQELSKQNDLIDKVSDIDNEPGENNAQHANKEFSSEQYQETKHNVSNNKVSNIDNDLIENDEQYRNNEVPSEQVDEMSHSDLINKVSDIEYTDQPLNNEHASEECHEMSKQNDLVDIVCDIDNEPVENNAQHLNKGFSSDQYQKTLKQNDSINKVSDIDNHPVKNDEQYPNNEVPSEQVHEMSQNDLINEVSDIESNDQLLNNELVSEAYQEMSKQNYSVDRVSDIDIEPVENNAQNLNKEFSSEQYQETFKQNDSSNVVSDIDNDFVENHEHYPNNEVPSEQVHEMSKNDLINKVSDIESKHQPLNNEHASKEYQEMSEPNESINKISDIDNEPVENNDQHPNKEFSSEQYQEMLKQNDDPVENDEQNPNNEIPSEQVHEMSKNDVINKVSDAESDDQQSNVFLYERHQIERELLENTDQQYQHGNVESVLVNTESKKSSDEQHEEVFQQIDQIKDSDIDNKAIIEKNDQLLNNHLSFEHNQNVSTEMDLINKVSDIDKKFVENSDQWQNNESILVDVESETFLSEHNQESNKHIDSSNRVSDTDKNGQDDSSNKESVSVNSMSQTCPLGNNQEISTQIDSIDKVSDVDKNISENNDQRQENENSLEKNNDCHNNKFALVNAELETSPSEHNKELITQIGFINKNYDTDEALIENNDQVMGSHIDFINKVSEIDTSMELTENSDKEANNKEPCLVIAKSETFSNKQDKEINQEISAVIDLTNEICNLDTNELVESNNLCHNSKNSSVSETFPSVPNQDVSAGIHTIGKASDSSRELINSKAQCRNNEDTLVIASTSKASDTNDNELEENRDYFDNDRFILVNDDESSTSSSSELDGEFFTVIDSISDTSNINDSELLENIESSSDFDEETSAQVESTGKFTDIDNIKLKEDNQSCNTVQSLLVDAASSHQNNQEMPSQTDSVNKSIKEIDQLSSDEEYFLVNIVSEIPSEHCQEKSTHMESIDKISDINNEKSVKSSEQQQNKESFLVDAVSETFPSQSSRQMSTRISSTNNADALTQIKNAAHKSDSSLKETISIVERRSDEDFAFLLTSNDCEVIKTHSDNQINIYSDDNSKEKNNNVVEKPARGNTVSLSCTETDKAIEQSSIQHCSVKTDKGTTFEESYQENVLKQALVSTETNKVGSVEKCSIDHMNTSDFNKADLKSIEHNAVQNCSIEFNDVKESLGEEILSTLTKRIIRNELPEVSMEKHIKPDDSLKRSITEKVITIDKSNSSANENTLGEGPKTSNILNDETLIQICTAIKNQCSRVKLESTNNINFSVSVTISARIEQNTSIHLDTSHDNSSLLSNGKTQKEHTEQKVTKKFVQKHNRKKPKRLSENKKIGQTESKKKELETVGQISSSNTETAKTHDVLPVTSPVKKKWRKSGTSKRVICKRQAKKTSRSLTNKVFNEVSNIRSLNLEPKESERSINEVSKESKQHCKSDSVETETSVTENVFKENTSEVVSDAIIKQKQFESHTVEQVEEEPSENNITQDPETHVKQESDNRQSKVKTSNTSVLPQIDFNLPLSTTVRNNFTKNKSESKSTPDIPENHSQITQNKQESQQNILPGTNADTSNTTNCSAMNRSVVKFPDSKRLSNVVVHTIRQPVDKSNISGNHKPVFQTDVDPSSTCEAFSKSSSLQVDTNKCNSANASTGLATNATCPIVIIVPPPYKLKKHDSAVIRDTINVNSISFPLDSKENNGDGLKIGIPRLLANGHRQIVSNKSDSINTVAKSVNLKAKSRLNISTSQKVQTRKLNILKSKRTVKYTGVNKYKPQVTSDKINANNISPFEHFKMDNANLFANSDGQLVPNTSNKLDSVKENNSPSIKSVLKTKSSLNISTIKKAQGKMISILKSKRTLKFAGAKVDKVFTIDKNSFRLKDKGDPTMPSKVPLPDPQAVFTRKPLFKEPRPPNLDEKRQRRDMISTKDLVCAGRILGSAAKERTEKQIFNLAEKTLETMALANDNERLLKNVPLAESCINIGNMKKKLRANICEDMSRCKNSTDHKT